MSEDLKSLGVDVRRALRWTDRLFGRVGKAEREIAKLKAELKETQKCLSNDILYNHNHLVDVIERRIKEALSQK